VGEDCEKQSRLTLLCWAATTDEKLFWFLSGRLVAFSPENSVNAACAMETRVNMGRVLIAGLQTLFMPDHRSCTNRPPVLLIRCMHELGFSVCSKY